MFLAKVVGAHSLKIASYGTPGVPKVITCQLGLVKTVFAAVMIKLYKKNGNFEAMGSKKTCKMVNFGSNLRVMDHPDVILNGQYVRWLPPRLSDTFGFSFEAIWRL